MALKRMWYGDDGPASQLQKKRKPDQSHDSDVFTSAPSLRSLQQLLDLSALNHLSDITERFDQVGRALLHDFHLVIQHGDVETSFKILELEFYLQKAECHEDPFTHGSEEQKVSGRWYFHRAPRRSVDSHRSSTSLTEYRGGTRKGLDLTLGGPAPETSSPHFASTATTSNAGSDQPLLRGGVLLRTIQRVSDSKVISGPSLLVDQILLLSKASSISELVVQKWENNTSAFRTDIAPTSMFLRPSTMSTPSKPHVYRSPRIGLDLSHPGTTVSGTHPRVVFLSKPYRYFTHPDLLTANGRIQTLLGILQTCLETSCVGKTLESVKLRKELVRITGLKEPTVMKYLVDYRKGVDGGALKAFVGPVGKGASGSPSTYLKMMGTLERLRLEAENTK